MKARILLVTAIAAIMVLAVATSGVEASGLYKFDSNVGTYQQVSSTLYTDLGSANRNAQNYFYGARPGGGVDEIDGTSGTWVTTSINDTAYSRVVGLRGASGKVYGAKVAGGLDLMTKSGGVWTTAGMADAGARHFSDLTPDGSGPIMHASPETAADYFNASHSGIEVYSGVSLVGLYQSEKIYHDIAYANIDQMGYAAGAAGLDYYNWGYGEPLGTAQANINGNLYNSITGSEKDAYSVFGAKAGGGVTKSYRDASKVWHTVDLAKPGSTEYSILWYDWGSPFLPPYDPDWIFAAGKDGGLWRLDALDVADPLLLSTAKFTSLVGGREKGGIIFGVTAGVVPEPGSLAAMGMGMMSLVGFAIRRRK